jgi:hypothetical protein
LPSTASIGLEIISAVVSGVLLSSTSHATDIDDKKWDGPKNLSWLTYIFGLVFFLLSVCAIPWVADRENKWIGPAIVLPAAGGLAYVL